MHCCTHGFHTVALVQGMFELLILPKDNVTLIILVTVGSESFRSQEVGHKEVPQDTEWCVHRHTGPEMVLWL